MRSRLPNGISRRGRPTFARAAAMSLAVVSALAIAGPEAKAADETIDPPHPLAARYPGRLVVVCEAGCPNSRGPEVVFTERIPQRRTAVQGMMQPTSARLDAAPPAVPSSVIVCEAGCYDTPKFYKSPYVPPRPATALKATLPADTGPVKRGPFSPIR